jgi:hypothetical protein
MPKKADVTALRAIRKSTNLSGKLAHKAGHVLNRVEQKANRMIVGRTGSDTGNGSVSLDTLIHHKFPYMSPIHPALPNIGQKPAVVVFVPSLTPRGFYGGIATLLIVSATLANELDYDYTVVQTSGFEKNTAVLDFLGKQGVTIDPVRFHTLDVSQRTPDYFAYLPLHADDVVVVSAWWDAYTASRLPLRKKFVYMVQDYEPIFYNLSDEGVFAESTYHTQNFLPVCNTQLLHKFFTKRGYDYIRDNAVWFEPAVAPGKPGKPQDSNVKKIFLYGRPSVSRNLFYNALLALDIAMQDERLQQHTWELYIAGESDIPSVKLHSGHVVKNLGKMDLDDYYRFARTIDVAVSPMLAPHPNYPTLELASLGASVVSTKYETKQDLSFYSKNILMAEPTSQDMAAKIIQAASMSPAERYKNLSSNNISDSWAKNLQEPVKKIAAKLKA